MDNARIMILEALEAQGLPYELEEHPPAMTMQDMADYGLTEKGLVAKNLFLRDAKGKRHFLVVVAGDKPVDLKTLGGTLGTRLSFASAERLEKYLHLQQGEVSPLGVLLDEEAAVEVFFDEDLRGQARVGVHPGDNTATLFMDFENIEKIIKNHGNKAAYIKMP